MTDALSHVRVIEIGGLVSAAYCTKLLADLGADVVKVEQLGTGDGLRSMGTFPADSDDRSVGGLFCYLNANKRSVAFDLKGGGDIDSILKLAAGADIIVENLGPGGLEKLNLGFGRLKRVNPAISLVRISDFGQTGPLAKIPATDFTVQSAGGWVSKHVSGRPDPVQVGGNLADYAVASFAACAALTAWKSTRDIGEAVEVDVSKQECLLNTLPQPALFLEVLSLLGMGLPEDRVFPVPGIVRCKDGYVGINVLTAQHWADCCNMTGLPEWIPRQLEVIEVGPALDQFTQEIQPWLMEHGTEEIVELCQTLRLPAVPIGTGANLPEMPQLKSRSFFIKDFAGQFIQPGFPYRLEATPASLRRPAPRLGEHNAEVAGNPWRDLKESFGPELKTTKPGDGLAFSGLKVIDFGTFWAGPFVSCYLGAMGADVIKIESAERPDTFRYSMAYPQLGDDWYEQGGVWQGTNLNKRDLTLNLNDEDARKVFEKLVARSDVIIENFSPRVINNLGFGVDRLKELNPALIIVRMPGLGLEGPWKDYVAWAMSFEQACGAAWITGDPDGLPLNPGGFSDPTIGMHAAVAVQAALDYRNRTGVAQFIEVAQLETASCWTAEQVIAYSMTGKLQGRTGNRSETIAPQGLYQCSDGQWIAISIRDDDEWVRLIDAMGSPDGAGDSRFASLKGRLDNHDEIDKLISSWCGGLNSERSVTTLRSSGIPVATVMAAPSLYDDPHLSARKFYQVLDHATMGQRRYPRWPMIQNPGPEGLHRYGAPTLGQHNAEVLRELGLTESELENFAGK